MWSKIATTKKKSKPRFQRNRNESGIMWRWLWTWLIIQCIKYWLQFVNCLFVSLFSISFFFFFRFRIPWNSPLVNIRDLRHKATQRVFAAVPVQLLIEKFRYCLAAKSFVCALYNLYSEVCCSIVAQSLSILIQKKMSLILILIEMESRFVASSKWWLWQHRLRIFEYLCWINCPSAPEAVSIHQNLKNLFFGLTCRIITQMSHWILRTPRPVISEQRENFYFVQLEQ